MATKLTILQGKTFRRVLRWEAPPIIYKAISGITKSAPVTINAVGHGLTSGWRVAVVSVKGMAQINADNSPLKDSDYHQAVVVDADHIQFNDVNSSEFSDYKSGGYLQFNTPVDMAGYTARMSIKTKVGGTELMSLTTVNGRLVINNTLKTISIVITAADTALITWSTGVFELEMVSGTGEVSTLLVGTVNVTKEIVT